ncbi:MAG: hypothetical protein CVV03_10275 [Firmicutes bacterium HGW-Firmicutes-8]|nr:MAG: hypothetical protein CVV03_10275 [Firmicutes bacterium HGW-Firmicutes-8]
MKNRILQAAVKKINQYGFRKFTVKDIAAELNISKKTIYEYYASKDEIISAVVDTYVELEKAGVYKALENKGNWSDKLQAVVLSFVQDRPVWVTEELRRFFPKEWGKMEAQRIWRTPIVDEVFSQAVKSGEIRSDIPPSIIQLTLYSSFSALFDYDKLDKLGITFNQAMAEVMKILYTGILTKKGRINISKDRKYVPG